MTSPRLTEAQARQAVARMPGINVRRWKGTWHYEARFNAQGKWHTRATGQDLQCAMAQRVALISAYGRGNDD